MGIVLTWIFWNSRFCCFFLPQGGGGDGGKDVDNDLNGSWCGLIALPLCRKSCTEEPEQCRRWNKTFGFGPELHMETSLLSLRDVVTVPCAGSTKSRRSTSQMFLKSTSTSPMSRMLSWRLRDSMESVGDSTLNKSTECIFFVTCMTCMCSDSKNKWNQVYSVADGLTHSLPKLLPVCDHVGSTRDSSQCFRAARPDVSLYAIYWTGFVEWFYETPNGVFHYGRWIFCD